jgi:hypothetical protein
MARASNSAGKKLIRPKRNDGEEIMFEKRT